MNYGKFDTLKAVDELTMAGFSEQQARSIVVTIDSLASEVATKADLDALEARMEASMDTLEASMKASMKELETKFGTMMFRWSITIVALNATITFAMLKLVGT